MVFKSVRGDRMFDFRTLHKDTSTQHSHSFHHIECKLYRIPCPNIRLRVVDHAEEALLLASRLAVADELQIPDER